MNKTHHPLNKFQRQLISAKKTKPNETKREEAKDRAGRVWKKLTVEHVKEQETEDELRSAWTKD